ncbi:MAG: leucine-rich repeat domain-containing protein [Planctomycetota bacterium]
MKHHFADMLDRSAGLWSMVPNVERWSFHFEDVADAPEDSTVLTLTKRDRNWERAHDLPGLEELTLHEPSREQIALLQDLPRLKRLRISHARPKSLGVLEGHSSLEELVLEYVSGFESLAPVGSLSSLRSLHMENLRRVRDFSGLLPGPSLRSLEIVGTLDWDQPIEDLDFLDGLPALEVFALGWCRVLAESPIFAGLCRAQSLKCVRFGWRTVRLEDYAYLEAMRPDVEGAIQEPFLLHEPREETISEDDIRTSMPAEEFLELTGARIDADGRRSLMKPPSAWLLGRGRRDATGKLETIERRCREHAELYRRLVDACRADSR